MGIIIAVVVAVVQLFAPKYLSAVIGILKLFIPDSVPVIDEVVGIIIPLLKFKNGE